MGSSHCEQMLRDNVDEWARDGHGDYNFVTNPRRRAEVLGAARPGKWKIREHLHAGDARHPRFRHARRRHGARKSRAAATKSSTTSAPCSRRWVNPDVAAGAADFLSLQGSARTLPPRAGHSRRHHAGLAGRQLRLHPRIFRRARAPAQRRRRGLLSRFVLRPAAGLSLALLDAARAHRRGNDQGLRLRREPGLDPQRGRFETGGTRHRILPQAGVESARVERHEHLRFAGATTGARFRPDQRAGTHLDSGRILPAEFPAQAGAHAGRPDEHVFHHAQRRRGGTTAGGMAKIIRARGCRRKIVAARNARCLF